MECELEPSSKPSIGSIGAGGRGRGGGALLSIPSLLDSVGD
jgi:hypothetical protein